MVIFHSYVGLPEGIYIYIYRDFPARETAMCRSAGPARSQLVGNAHLNFPVGHVSRWGQGTWASLELTKTLVECDEFRDFRIT